MVIRVPRFWNKEMTSWPKNDALNILYFEMVLMSLFIIMNATDTAFQELNAGNPISQFVAPFFANFEVETLHFIERGAWWLHIIGIFIFLNYLYYSKHLHVLLAFPNTYFANLNPKGQLDNLESVTNEVKLMMDPNADPFAVTPVDVVPSKFGASDITDLTWVQLMNAYTCTECGRCTSVCPANITGKELSPRAIMMKTRDRTEEIGKIIDKKGSFEADGKQLLNDYILPEELWACTSCNACVEACPVNINPLSIIIDMRRFLVMEQSAAPQELNAMMTNIENNGAPWQYSQMDRLNWKDE
jgi:heterodisulfide reductase subunit C